MATLTTTLFGSGGNLFGGVPDPFAVPTVKGVQEAGGGTTTSTDTSGNVTTLPTFVVKEPKITGGELGNIFSPGQLTGATPGISLGTGIGSLGGGLGGGPTSTVKVGDTTKTVSFDDIVNREIQAEIERMRNQPNPVFSSDAEFGKRIEEAANRGLEIYNATVGPGRTLDLESSSGTTPGQKGLPIILPIPGLDPTTAAAITALGLIFSGGKIARLDPNNPAGSVVGAVQGVGQTGQNVVDVATGKTSIGEIWNPGSTGTPSGGGTSTTGTTGSGGQQTTGTGAVGVVGGIFGGGTTPSNTQSTQQNPPASTVVLPGSQVTDVSKIQTAVSKPAANQQVPNTGGPGAIVGTASSVGSGPKGGDISEIDNVTPVVSPGLKDFPTPEEQPAEGKPVDPFKRTGDTDTTTCPSPDTPILLADGTQIRAGDLKLGMLVRTSHEHTKEWGNYPITNVRIVKDKRLCLLFDSSRIVCSPTHKFSTGNGWKEAEKYRVGEALQHQTVRAIEYLEDGDVVAITVDDAHTYVSNGLLSHNKTPIVIAPPTSTTRTDTTTEKEVVVVKPPVVTGGSGTASPNESASTTSCPSPETPILLPDLTTIPAGELKVGMKVRTRLEYEQVWGDYPITRVEIVKDRRLKFTFDYGTFICSTTHKFSHDDWEWKEASNYRVGDKIQGHKILAIEDDGIGDVVVITVDEAHTYVAGPFLSHNKTQAPAVTPVPTTTSTTPAGGTFNVTVTGDQTPITYTAPKAGDPFQRFSWQEASTQLGGLNAPVGRQFLGYEMGPDNKPVAVYSQPTGKTVGEEITGTYGKMAGGMTKEDINRLKNTYGDLLGPLKPGQSLQQAMTDAAIEQTQKANNALRAGNLADAAEFGMQAKRLRDEANAQLYGDTGTISQYATAAQNQVARDIEALRAAERGELSRESLRTAQQAAREAAGARGQVMSRGAMAQEVLNREAAIQQRQQQARQNLAQSMGQLGQGIGYQAANVFDPMAAVLGQQYGMQSQNVGLNQALYNQGMGLASGQGGYGFAQQMVNPFSQYAADVYGTNVNARNAFMIQEANRLAALEAAKMGEAAARNAANTKLALGGVDFLYKYGAGQGWWG